MRRLPTRLCTRNGVFAALEFGPPGAPAVLCVHGFPDHAPSLAPLAERLAAEGYHVVCPWLRGYHPSVLEGPYDVEQIADDFYAIADVVSPHRPVGLVGHDWGAVATYVAITRAPDRFRAAVTLAVPHPMAFLAQLARPRQLFLSRYMLAMQIPGWSDRRVARDDFAYIDQLWRRWSPGYRLPAADRAALVACLEQSMPAPVLYYRALFRPFGDFRRRLRRAASDPPIRVPTLYLHGADDGCIAPPNGPASRFFAARHEVEVLLGLGHFLALEAPDTVADRVVRWLVAAP